MDRSLPVQRPLRFAAWTRPLILPIAITVLGIVGSVSVHTQLAERANQEMAERLADAGEELVRVTEDLETIAVGQVLATRGLFESSAVVTRNEFEHFVAVIGEPLDNGVAYAPLLRLEDLHSFEVRARTSQPEYAITGIGPSPDPDADGLLWPILYRSDESGGFPAGFDFGSHPSILEAIDAALLAERPVASGFVQVPGDDFEGDLVIVAPIKIAGEPMGVAALTLRLDELLASRVEDLLGSPLAVKVIEADSEEVAALGWVEGSWRRTLQIADQRIVLILEPTAFSSPGWSTVDWFLLLGIATSALAGWLVRAGSRRRDMARELALLQKTITEKDRFLASVSHELRTPLTSVVGNLEILGGNSFPITETDRRILVKDARDSALDLERLVEDHLTAARLSSGVLTIKSEVVDLDAVVSRIVDHLNLPNRIEVRCGELGSCMGDSLRIRQIVRNILRNAGSHALSEIEIRTVRKEGRLTLEILNDGEPVSSAILDKLFQPFAGASSPGQPESIGLGLAISRDLARRMGGDLFHSHRGTRVCFSLELKTAPVVEESAGADRVVVTPH
jgi:signal transduction histidine kinase